MSGQVNCRHRRAGGDLAAAELEIWGAPAARRTNRMKTRNYQQKDTFR